MTTQSNKMHYQTIKEDEVKREIDLFSMYARGEIPVHDIDYKSNVISSVEDNGSTNEMAPLGEKASARLDELLSMPMEQIEQPTAPSEGNESICSSDKGDSGSKDSSSLYGWDEYHYPIAPGFNIIYTPGMDPRLAEQMKRFGIGRPCIRNESFGTQSESCSSDSEDSRMKSWRQGQNKSSFRSSRYYYGSDSEGSWEESQISESSEPDEEDSHLDALVLAVKASQQKRYPDRFKSSDSSSILEPLNASFYVPSISLE